MSAPSPIAENLLAQSLLAQSPWTDPWQWLFGVLMFLTAVFLILLVLVQRGRGGGLAGALGGAGGQSAFGSRAGDMFTRITMVTAGFWILLCMAAILLTREQSVFGEINAEGANPPAETMVGEDALVDPRGQMTDTTDVEE